MEFLDVVDINDNVVGRAAKDEVHKKGLSHRIVHVLIFNNKGEMLLRLRNNNLKFAPGHWSTSVGGHVQSGETYEQGALREYKEELGKTTQIKFLWKDLFHDEKMSNKFLVTFKSIDNGPFDFDKTAIERLEFFSLNKIKEMIKTDKFHPELLFLLKKHYNIE